jgi:4-amino-4-deoxy-L-arabinose transferase-like glycosyltransferase
MSMLARPARMPWWAAVALLALGARLLFLFAADEPLLYSHPYNYFHGALAILEHPDPWRFIGTSDAWHLWLGPWTIAPLYYLFLAGVMAVFGPHLLAVQLVQIGLDVLAAVLTGGLGRRLAGPRGAWAGVAYAVNFHAIEQCTTTLTENLSNVLLLAGIVMLIADAAPRRRRWMAAAGGLLLGLSSLARAVATAFVPLAGLWRWLVGRDRAALVRAAVICAAAAAAVVPWTIRNAIVTGDFIPVETNGIYNLYDDNTFVEGERRVRQEAVMRSQPTLAQQRDMAVRMALRGIARQPDAFVEKAWRNLLHLVRPDGLQLLLVVEEPMPAWRHAALFFLDDLIVLPAVVLFAVFLIAGRPSPERGLIAVWTGYYLLMVVVLFHNEIRYRSTLLPFALAGAAGGWALLARREGSPWRVRGALILGGGLAALVVAPYVGPAARALRSLPGLRAMRQAVEKGDAASARRHLDEAVRADPGSARPWLRYGRALARHGDPAGALDAYDGPRGGAHTSGSPSWCGRPCWPRPDGRRTSRMRWRRRTHSRGTSIPGSRSRWRGASCPPPSPTKCGSRPATTVPPAGSPTRSATVAGRATGPGCGCARPRRLRPTRSRSGWVRRPPRPTRRPWSASRHPTARRAASRSRARSRRSG